MARQRDILWEAVKNFQTTRMIGEIEVKLPSPPLIKDIANHDLPIVKQKFQYNPLFKKNEEPSSEFLEQEFQRFKDGYWFFSNGNLEYLTPYHYGMLNYSIIDGERPIFTDSQRDFFYVWDAIEKDPYSFGLCLTTSRRWGKGEVSIIIAYIRATMNMYHHCGIQSKTSDDAKLLFAKLIQRWQRMPDFLKPTDEGVTNPKSELRFFEPGVKSSKGGKKEYKEAINSWIDFKSTVSNAYDGDKLHTYIMDEAAKNEKSDPYETWDIVKYCLTNGSKIIGKALITTTVESTESVSASESYQRMWEDSNPNERLPNGRTKTGLYRYYNPGYMGYYGTDEATGEPFIDEYGYSKQEFTKEYILRGREGLEGNQLSAQIRKLSLTVSEAFMSDGAKCYFNAYNLEAQKTYLKEYAPKNLVRQVTFYRREDDSVTYRDDPNGKFQLVWDFPNMEQTNKHKYIQGYEKVPPYMPIRKKVPTNTDFGAIGVDPYAFTETVSGKSSMGVAYLTRKGDAGDPENSNMPIVRYADRPPRKEIFHDNVCMLAEWAGVKINYEGDVNEFVEEYEKKWKDEYLMNRPKSAIDPTKSRQHRAKLAQQKGTLSRDSFSLQRQFDVTHLYVEDHSQKIPFIELCDCLLRYDHIKRTKSDDTVAFGMSLIGCSENVKLMEAPKPVKLMAVKKSKKYY